MPSETKMTEEPIAWIKLSDMDQCQTSECAVHAYSVEQMYVDGDESVPLYSPDQVDALLAKFRSTVSVLQGRLNEVTEERDNFRKLITEHNMGCYQACRAQRRDGRCDCYTDRGMSCPDCPAEWGIEEIYDEAMQTAQQDGEET